MTPAFKRDHFALDAGAAPFGSEAPAILPAPELSIIVPTYREAENVATMIEALDTALAGVRWEVIFVDDDSPDGTADLARRLGSSDNRVRCLRRIGRRGLAGASIEGMLASSAEIVAVIDCDMQHDETRLPVMLAEIRAGADLVIATRYQSEARTATGLSPLRQRASTAATRLTQTLLGTPATDPMSGFFMLRRDRFNDVAPSLSTGGFKILLDILASRPDGWRIAEVPYTFRPRHAGTSKLGNLVIVEFFSLLAAKVTGDRISPRFVMFALVGASGVISHLVALKLLLAAGLGFGAAQIAASYSAMTWNFVLNNTLTYRDRRLTGLAAVTGLLSFYLVCSVGTLANIGVAQLVYGEDANWWHAGLAGALMAAVFNYSASSILTWRKV